ncbi:MAG: SDR family NAD(P)-dependent oxidoreductase [Bacillota bacterium]
MAVYPEMAGRAAIITGGSGGIGRAAALALAQNGVCVLVADVRREDIDSAVSEIIAAGGRAAGAEVDVRCAEQVQKMVDTCAGRFGSVDYLVNCAGIFKHVSFMEMQLDDWKETLDVNLTGTFLCMQKALAQMIKAGYGRIVNLSSHAAVRGSALHAHYCASKEGIVGLSRAVMREVSEYGIRINCIAPDIIKTQLTMTRDEERQREWRKRIPMGRFGEPSECADLIVYLLSDASSYITGQNIWITGGTL